MNRTTKVLGGSLLIALLALGVFYPRSTTSGFTNQPAEKESASTSELESSVLAEMKEESESPIITMLEEEENVSQVQSIDNLSVAIIDTQSGMGMEFDSEVYYAEHYFYMINAKITNHSDRELPIDAEMFSLDVGGVIIRHDVKTQMTVINASRDFFNVDLAPGETREVSVIFDFPKEFVESSGKVLIFEPLLYSKGSMEFEL